MELLTAGAAALGICLTAEQKQQFRRYYEEMVDWNTRMNLTSVTDCRDVQTRHFVDSLAASLAIPRNVLDSGRFADVGSGAGFPGMPLKIAFPSLEATLIESTGKKARYLLHLRDALGLRDVEIRTGRAEALAHDPGLRERFDFVLSRAVARLAVLAELTLPFCRVGGTAILHKKPHVGDEIEEARTAIDTLGGTLREVKEFAVHGLCEHKALVVLEKARPTPERYPRRPGIPSKRPL